MWKLEARSTAERQQHHVHAGSELLVSRSPGTWMVITADASVSRKHASLHLEHTLADVKRGKTATLMLTDQNAKNGTYVRQSSAHRHKDANASVLTESHRIEPGSSVQLQHGDVVRFGLSASYRVVLSRVMVATSMLPNNEAVLQHLQLLGVAFSKDWNSSCTHLVMDAVKLSAKVACALASGGLIVTPAFFPALLGALKEKNPVLPPAHDFLPAIAEPSIQPSPALFAPNCKRKVLFEGKKFCFGTEKGHRRLGTIIRLAGGECAVLEACHEDLLCSGAAMLLRTVEDTSSPAPSFTSALKLLKKAGLHIIPESDIVLAVLYCSTERFCNPSVSQQLLLDRPAPHTQTQSPMAVLAAETQDLPVSASKRGAGPTSLASCGRANAIPETPSSTCSSSKSATVGGSIPTSFNKAVENGKSPSEAKLSTCEDTRSSNLPNVERPTPSLNVISLPVHESTSHINIKVDTASKKRYRSGENMNTGTAAKRPAPAKLALPDTQDLEISQLQADGDLKVECSLNLSTFAPPLASTQIHEDELQQDGCAKRVADNRDKVLLPSAASAQKTTAAIPKTVSAAAKNALKSGVTCIPPTPTPPSQASISGLPDERTASIPAAQSNGVAPQTTASSGQSESKIVLEISPSLESLQSFPTETLGRTTQFCPELQTAPLPSLEPPCLDGILNSKSASKPAPDVGSLGNPLTYDPFTLLNPNLSEKEDPLKTTDGFQLPAAAVRRRKIQVQQTPENSSSSTVNPGVGGIKRTRSTVELEEENKRQRLASTDAAPAPAVSVKQEQCTPTPVIPTNTNVTAATPASSTDGFVSSKRRLHTTPNKTPNQCDGPTPPAPVSETVNKDVALDENEVKPTVNVLDKNITVCRTIMVSLVLKTSVLGEDYQPLHENAVADSTKNFKRFRKVRHAGAVASLPRIIGGRDLVPHTTFASDTADKTFPSTCTNPRSLWLSQHPEVTRHIEQEDQEREEDQADSIPNGTRSSHSFGRSGPVSRQSSVANCFSGAGTSKTQTQFGSINNRAVVGRGDFSQYQMPSANVKRRIPRTRV